MSRAESVPDAHAAFHAGLLWHLMTPTHNPSWRVQASHQSGRHCSGSGACLRAQGMLATLELLPMWSGVDPDVEMFASGDVAEEDDEWKGGHSLDGSSAPAPDNGQHPDPLCPSCHASSHLRARFVSLQGPCCSLVAAWQRSKPTARMHVQAEA